MRREINPQDEFVFQPSSRRVTNDYFHRYEAIDGILRGNGRILDLVHRDLKKALEGERKRDRSFQYTSDHVRRILICHILEGETQRGIVVRVDDSPRLRRFTRTSRVQGCISRPSAGSRTASGPGRGRRSTRP